MFWLETVFGREVKLLPCLGTVYVVASDILTLAAKFAFLSRMPEDALARVLQISLYARARLGGGFVWMLLP
jgi:hypothetical protein